MLRLFSAIDQLNIAHEYLLKWLLFSIGLCFLYYHQFQVNSSAVVFSFEREYYFMNPAAEMLNFYYIKAITCPSPNWSLLFPCFSLFFFFFLIWFVLLCLLQYFIIVHIMHISYAWISLIFLGLLLYLKKRKKYDIARDSNCDFLSLIFLFFFIAVGIENEHWA